MHSSGSFHLTLLERVRGYLDSPTVDAKFTDAYIIAHNIMPAMNEVLERLNLTRDNPYIIRFPIELEAQTEYYQCPHGMGNVLRLCTIDQTGNLLDDYIPEGIFHPIGPNWALEGDMLVVRPFPSGARTIDLWFTPSGDVLTHYSTTGSLSDDKLTLTFGTPTYGQIERRRGGLLGHVLRIITDDVIEERMITEHDPSAGTVTVRLPFDLDLSTTDGITPVTYEVAPKADQALYDAIALRAAMKLGVPLKIDKEQRQGLTLEYNQAIRTISNKLNNMQMRMPEYLAKDTVDNQDRFNP